LDQAQAYFEQSLALRRDLGEKSLVAGCLNNLGSLASDRGDYDAAWLRHQESLALRRELGDQSRIAQSLQNLGEVALRRGQYEQATLLYRESLVIFRDLGERLLVGRNLDALARVADGTGSPERAARLLGAAAALRERVRASLQLSDKSIYEQSVAAVRDRLGTAAFQAAWAAGAALPLDAAIDEALDC
jgi:tetratricopeptide (TPR) repeat protein